MVAQWQDNCENRDLGLNPLTTLYHSLPSNTVVRRKIKGRNGGSVDQFGAQMLDSISGRSKTLQKSG